MSVEFGRTSAPGTTVRQLLGHFGTTFGQLWRASGAGRGGELSGGWGGWLAGWHPAAGMPGAARMTHPPTSLPAWCRPRVPLHPAARTPPPNAHALLRVWACIINVWSGRLTSEETAHDASRGNGWKDGPTSTAHTRRAVGLRARCARVCFVRVRRAANGLVCAGRAGQNDQPKLCRTARGATTASMCTRPSGTRTARSHTHGEVSVRPHACTRERPRAPSPSRGATPSRMPEC